MKPEFLAIIIAVFVSLGVVQSANAGLSGFTGNVNLCKQCVDTVNCGSKAMADHLASNPMQCSGPWHDDYVHEDDETVGSVVAACNALFPGVPNLKTRVLAGMRYAAHYAYEVGCANTRGDELDTFKAGLAVQTIYLCQAEGYCECGAGYYVQPRGLTPNEWAANSECKQCPFPGTSKEYENLFLSSCCLPDGDFSDDFGSGVLIGSCCESYGPDPMDMVNSCK